MESLGGYFDRISNDLMKQMIICKLGLKDLIRFGAISRSGRSISEENQSYLRSVPWLMIARDEQTQTGTFLSISESKIYNIKLTAEASESFCSGGSTQGYLMMANGNGNFLYNPFTQNVISLPKQYVPRADRVNKTLTSDERSYFTKYILCCYPAPNMSLCVMALCNNARVIEMCRPHDSEWFVYGVSKEENGEYSDDEFCYDDDDDELSEDEKDTEPEVVKDEEQIKLEKNEENKGSFTDVLSYKGMLYALTRASTLVTFDLPDDSSNPLSYNVLNMTPIYLPFVKGVLCYRYLVESCGELLMVHRYCNIVDNGDGLEYSTVKFIVYKLNQLDDFFQWVQVESLVDQMLFLGRNSAVSISAAATGFLGFKGNCIYFIEDYWPYWWLGINSKTRCLDNGVFYLDDGRVESYYSLDDARQIKCQPIWITPNSFIEPNTPFAS